MPGGVAAVARDISVLAAGGMLVGRHITNGGKANIGFFENNKGKNLSTKC